MWESHLIINPKKKIQSHRNGEGTLWKKKKGKGKKFFKYNVSKIKILQGVEALWEKKYTNPTKRMKLFQMNAFKVPALKKKIKWDLKKKKKNLSCCFGGKKIQSPKFTAVSASKTLLILANGTSSLIVHGWVFSLGLGKFTLALKKVVVSGHLVLKKKIFFNNIYCALLIDSQVYLSGLYVNFSCDGERKP